MPELPEVETVRAGLAPAVGQTVISTEHDGKGRIRRLEALQGQKIELIGRRGKLLIVKLQQDTMLAHLGMTGRLLLDPSGQQPHTRALLRLEGSERPKLIVFADPRRFGHLTVLPHQDVSSFPLLAGMGEEPFDIEAAGLRAKLRRRTGSVKGAILDQSVIAGVGNIYADEALWGAKIAPERPANSLTESEASELLSQIQKRMQKAIEQGGTTIRDHRGADGTKGTYINQLEVYGREGKECGRCGSELRKGRTAGRTTVHCAQCQR